MLMHQYLVRRMKKWNNFTMILKEQWLIVTTNIKTLQEISMQKIGTKTKEEDFKSMGAFGIGERNERGDRLIEFAEEHNLTIANTLFQKQHKKTNKQTNKQKKTRYWTWEPPDGETRNQIHFTLSSQRGILTNCEVITKADIGSDYRLVRMTLRINLRLARLKTIKKQKSLLLVTHKNSEA